jgi:hypothetical protein
VPFSHSSITTEVRQVAEPILVKLRGELPPEVVVAALERGKNPDFDTAVGELLATA